MSYASFCCSCCCRCCCRPLPCSAMLLSIENDVQVAVAVAVAVVDALVWQADQTRPDQPRPTPACLPGRASSLSPHLSPRLLAPQSVSLSVCLSACLRLLHLQQTLPPRGGMLQLLQSASASAQDLSHCSTDCLQIFYMCAPMRQRCTRAYHNKQ